MDDYNENSFLARENLEDSFIKSIDVLKAQGVKLPEDLMISQAKHKQLRNIKRRDRNEPGRLKKHLTEVEIEGVVKRVLRKQAEFVKWQLQRNFPDRKAIYSPPIELKEWEEDDINSLIRILTKAAKNGILLFGTGKPTIDYSLTNVRAAKWARDYTYKLIEGIDDKTRKAIQKTISLFVETPEMRLKDVIANLPFDELRAARIAVTETTRSYAQGQQLAGEDLKREFPDVEVVKIWFTNEDSLVCDICGPLGEEGHNEVEIDEEFSPGISNPPAHPNCRCWTESRTRI